MWHQSSVFWLILSELCASQSEIYNIMCTYAHQSCSSENRCKNNYNIRISSDVPRNVTSISIHFMICAWMCRFFMIDYCKIHFRCPFWIRSNRMRFQIDTFCNKTKFEQRNFLDLRNFIKSILSEPKFLVVEFDDRTTLDIKLVVIFVIGCFSCVTNVTQIYVVRRCMGGLCQPEY